LGRGGVDGLNLLLGDVIGIESHHGPSRGVALVPAGRTSVGAAANCLWGTQWSRSTALHSRKTALGSAYSRGCDSRLPSAT
jgi:hypothetical protein